MSLILFLCFIPIAILALLLIRKYSNIEFVSHARLLLKTWSVWLAGLGASIGAAVESFPDISIQAWNMLPPDIKGDLSPHLLGFIGPVMVVMSVLAQYIRQPKLKAQAEQLRNDQG